MLRRPADWTERAACDGLATPADDPWHPNDHTLTTTQLAYQYARARRVCSTCPVRLQCARYGLDLLPLTGVEGMFGGLTPKELRKVARRMGLPWQPVAQHGSRARYVAGCTDGPDSGACEPCKVAHREYEAQRRARVKEGRATGTDGQPALVRARGRGRRRASEGQLVMFPTKSTGRKSA